MDTRNRFGLIIWKKQRKRTLFPSVVVRGEGERPWIPYPQGYGNNFNSGKTAYVETKYQYRAVTVPLNAAPERRTKRWSPRFWPGDRFCELSFSYLSPDIEGGKCRPLDYMWQILFIHPTRFMTSSSIYTTPCCSYLLHVVHSSVSKYGAYLTIAHGLLQKLSIQGSVPLFKSCCIPYLYVLVDTPR